MIAALSLVAIMSSFVASTAMAAGFTDFTKDSSTGYAFDAVTNLVSKGVVDGTKANFNPTANISRAEVAKMVVVAAGLKADPNKLSNFPDVDAKAWDGKMKEYIDIAFAHGVIGGYQNGKFGPNDSVTRAQLAKMVVGAFNLAAYTPTTATFADVKEDWAKAAVETAYHWTVVNGLKDGSFAPDKAIIRADAAVMINNALTPKERTTVTPKPACTSCELEVSLSDESPSTGSVPNGTSVEFLDLDLHNAGADDLNVTSIKFTAGGLGDATKIDAVTMYVDGQRRGTAKDVGSSKEAQINLSNPIEVASGKTVTVKVMATIEANQTAQYRLDVLKATDITTDSGEVTGDFPIEGAVKGGVTVSVGELTLASDGTPATVKLGDKGASLAKFKLTNDNVEDVELKTVVLRRATASTAADDDFENLALWVDGASKATAESFSDKYVTFNFDTPLLIEKNKIKRFTLKGDVIDGAGKAVTVSVDSPTSDILATGAHYSYNAKITGTFAGSSVSIGAGAVTLEKVNAPTDKIKLDGTDVVLGTIKITANSGKTIELRETNLTVVANNAANFAEVENWEIYDVTTGIVYDLADQTGAGATRVFRNADEIALETGKMHEFQVRFDDVGGTAPAGLDGGEEFTVSIADASTDLDLREVENDTAVTDITPNSVSLKKVTVEAAGVTFTRGALSTGYTAVVGSKNVNAMRFDIKASETSDIKVTELAFTDTLSHATNVFVSALNLYEEGNTTPIKTISGASLASFVGTFEDLSITVPKNTTKHFYLGLDLVKASSTTTLKFRLSGYAAEDAVEGDAVYDAVAEDVLANGVIAGGEVGATSLLSQRTVTTAATGTLTVTVDNSDAATNRAKWVLGGTTSDFVASYEFTALNEAVTVKELTVADTGAGAMNDYVSEVILYKNDKTTEIARKTVTGDSVDFTGLTETFEPGTTNIYVKVVALKMGLNEAGDQSAADLTLTLDVTDAAGFDSGDDVAVAVSLASNGFGTVPVQVTGVSLLQKYPEGSTSPTFEVPAILNAGDNVAAIIKVTTAANTNKDSSTGSVLKTVLTQIKLKESLAAGTTVASYDLERINGADAAINDTVAGGYIAFDTTTFATSDNEIVNGQTAYFVVTAKTVVKGGAGDHDDYVKLFFDTFATSEVEYQSNNSVPGTIDAAITALRLEATKAEPNYQQINE